MTNYNISIVSDTVCPFCYIGKNRLELAIARHRAQFPDDAFKTTWFPFYLDPNAPKESVDKRAMYVARFGEQRFEMMNQRVSQMAAEVGINLKYGGKVGNTRDSHRVVQLAKTKGEERQTKVMERLFNAYFELNEDIVDHEVLVKAAVAGGLEEKEVREWLESDKGGPEVDREVAAAQRRFISGVPHFTIQDKYEVGGAEDPATFLQIFQEVKKSEAANTSGTTKVSSGNTC